MTTRQSMRWLEKVQKHISYPPDRKRVSNELYDHIMQRIAIFSSEGYSDHEADRRTAEAMGDPDEVGKALSRECRPFWGWTLLTLRALALILLVVFAFLFLRNLPGIRSEREWNRSALESFGSAGWIEQAAEAECGDYHFRLMRAQLSPQEDGGARLVIELRAWTWDPLLGAPMIDRYLTVADSGGNCYTSTASLSGAPAVRVHTEQHGLLSFTFLSSASHETVFTWTHYFIVEDFDETAKWATLDFDNGENRFSLPIRLEGAK